MPHIKSKINFGDLRREFPFHTFPEAKQMELKIAKSAKIVRICLMLLACIYGFILGWCLTWAYLLHHQSLHLKF